jgi:hypothetical protein
MAVQVAAARAPGGAEPGTVDLPEAICNCCCYGFLTAAVQVAAA